MFFHYLFEYFKLLPLFFYTGVDLLELVNTHWRMKSFRSNFGEDVGAAGNSDTLGRNYL